MTLINLPFISNIQVAKILTSLSITAFLVVTLSSCSRVIRPAARGRVPVNRGGGNVKNPNAGRPNANNPKYSTANFTGTLIKDVQYTTGADYRGSSRQLLLDVYKPLNAGNKKFPVVVLIHGGSFIGGNKANLSSTCSKLANNGYVAVSIDYRLGWGFVSRSQTTCNDSNKLKQAIYRASQDAHAALRYLAAHADEYNIDKNWMFIGGQSAGAITALITAFLPENKAGEFFAGYNKSLGGLDEEKNEPGAAYTLKGVISMWGAFVNPDIITSQNALPAIFFQGEKDRAVPFNSGPFIPCNSASLVYGTYPLYNRLKLLGETAIVHVDPQGGHGVFEEDFRVNNIVCFLNNVRQGLRTQVYLSGVQNSCGTQ